MKKLITIIMPDITLSETESVPEEIEILSYGGGIALGDAVKRAKGKYTLLSGGDTECDTLNGVFEVIDRANSDILSFDNGFLVKTSVLKGVSSKLLTDVINARVYAVMEAKTVENLTASPFKCEKAALEYSEENAVNFGAAIDEFKKRKAKLTKDIYSLAADLICANLTDFYISALIAVRQGKLSREALAGFDDKLKENIVLYLAFQKRFTAADLKKLREKQFKTGYFKYKKLLKMKEN